MPIVPSRLETVVRNPFNQAGLPGGCQFVVERDSRYLGQIATLTAKNEELEKRLNKNSSNSGRPPSSDGLGRKTKSRRTKSGRKPGGQPGCRRRAALTACPEYHGELSGEEVPDTRTRQVFNLPPLGLQVTEYRAKRNHAPGAGRQCAPDSHTGGTPPPNTGPDSPPLSVI